MITKNDLTSGNDATDRSTYTTASIDPADNAIVLIFVGSQQTASPADISGITGNGITYTKVASAVDSATNRRVSAWKGSNASPSAGTVDIAFGGTTQTGASWFICELTNYGPATAFGAQTATGTNATGAVSLTAHHSQAAVFGAVTGANGIVAVGPGTGFSELFESTAGGGVPPFECEWIQVAQPDAVVDWSLAGSVTNASLCFEIRVPSTLAAMGVG